MTGPPPRRAPGLPGRVYAEALPIVRRASLRIGDAIVTLAAMAIVGYGCALLFAELFAVDDPDRPTGSTLSGVGWALIGLMVGGVAALAVRMIVAAKWPRSRLTNRFGSFHSPLRS